MIRINLLAAERGAAKKSRAASGVTAAQRVTIGAALILLSTLVSAAGGTDVATSGSAAYYDLGLVTSSGSSSNSKPMAGAPGSNTCEGAG